MQKVSTDVQAYKYQTADIEQSHMQTTTTKSSEIYMQAERMTLHKIYERNSAYCSILVVDTIEICHEKLLQRTELRSHFEYLLKCNLPI